MTRGRFTKLPHATGRMKTKGSFVPIAATHPDTPDISPETKTGASVAERARLSSGKSEGADYYAVSSPCSASSLPVA